MKCLRLLPSLSIGLVVLAPPVGAVETVLLGDAAPAAALIPSAANGGNLLGQTWTAESFDATGWLTGVTGMKKRMTVDELRKNIESLPPADYDKMGYYDRWVISLTQTMIQRGVFTTDELARKLADVGRRNGV